jgi:hypothetical protein
MNLTYGMKDIVSIHPFSLQAGGWQSILENYKKIAEAVYLLLKVLIIKLTSQTEKFKHEKN